MILKQYSLLRHSFTLYSYATSKRRPAYQEIKQANALSQVDRKLSDYIFFKYDVNLQIEQELKELRNSTELLIKKTHPNIISRMQEILLKIPLGVMAQANLKIIKDIATIIKDKKVSQQTQDILCAIESRIVALENKNENFNSLFRLYRINQSEDMIHRNKRAQIILANIKQNSQGNLLIQQISFFFQKLCQVSILTSVQQQIRFILLKKIRAAIPEISIKLLSKLGRHLNSLSHYDFIPQQIEIAQQMFNKMVERDQEITDQMIQQVFKGSQYLYNSISLSQFYLKVIMGKIQKVKKHNSLQSHQLFHLIGLASSKILPVLQHKPQQKRKYQAFIIRYAQVNIKTLKHFQKIFRTLLTLVKEKCISPQLLQRMRPIVEDCKIKPSLQLLHQLTSFTSFWSYIKGNIKEATSSKTCSFLTDLIPVLINNQPKQRNKLWLQFAGKHSSKSQQLIQLIKKIQKLPIHIDFQQFKATISNYLICFISKMETNSFSKQERILLLSYFIDVPSIQPPTENIVKQCFFRIPTNIIEDVLQARLKDPSNVFIERYMLIAERLLRAQESEILLINFLCRLNVRYRQNSLSFSMKIKFKELIFTVIDKIDYFISKQATIQSLYVDFIRQFLVSYNEINNEYRLTGFYVKIVEILVNRIGIFDDNPQLKHLIIKQGLKYSIFSPQNIQVIAQIDDTCFTFFQIQKIKYFRNAKHQSTIDTIDHQTLPLIVLNRNMHHYLESGRPAISNNIASKNIAICGLSNSSISKILAQSTNTQFQQILRAVSYHSLPNSQAFFQFLVSFIKQLPTKIDFSNIQRYLFFNNFCSNFFIFEELQKKLLSWMHYYTENYEKIQDFQTHIAVLKLLKSIKLQLNFIDSKEQQNVQKKQGFQPSSPHYPLPAKYVNLLLEKYNNYPQKSEEILYHLLFTNFRFSHNQERKNLLKFLNVKQGKIVLTALLYLQPYFQEQQRLILLKKVDDCAKKAFENEGKIDFITLQQYYFLKKVYKKETQNFTIPEDCLNKTPFSKPNPQAFELLKSMASFLQCDLIKIKLQENQLYKLRHKGKIHYILFPSFDKQTSYHQFYYLLRLVKKLYDEDAFVTFIKKYNNGNYLDADKIFKGWYLMSKNQFKAFREWRNKNEKPTYVVKILEEDNVPPSQIVCSNSKFIHQLRHKKKINIKSKSKR